MNSNFRQEGNSLVAIDPINGGLQNNGVVVVNGSSDLSEIIRMEHNARVFTIKASMDAGSYYNHTIHVDGEGPEGFGTGSMTLHFTDQTDDTYALGLYSHTRKTHEVGYDSQSPNIVRITWEE